VKDRANKTLIIITVDSSNPTVNKKVGLSLLKNLKQ